MEKIKIKMYNLITNIGNINFDLEFLKRIFYLRIKLRVYKICFMDYKLKFSLKVIRIGVY